MSKKQFSVSIETSSRSYTFACTASKNDGKWSIQAISTIAIPSSSITSRVSSSLKGFRGATSFESFKTRTMESLSYVVYAEEKDKKVETSLDSRSEEDLASIRLVSKILEIELVPA